MIKEIDVKKLKKEMETQEINKSLLDTFKDDFETKHKDLIDSIKDSSNAIETLKNTITTDAKDEFEKNKVKKLLGGIGIREGKDIIYEDENALKWAKEKDLFLQLDKKAFEKVAVSLNLDFVKTKDKITVTFPKEIKL